jgi:hypothetical protein
MRDIILTNNAESIQRYIVALGYGEAQFINFSQSIGHQPYKLGKNERKPKENIALRYTKDKGYKVIGWRLNNPNNVLNNKQHICRIK